MYANWRMLICYFNLFLNVKLDSLSCSFTSISFLTTSCFFTLICIYIHILSYYKLFLYFNRHLHPYPLIFLLINYILTCNFIEWHPYCWILEDAALYLWTSRIYHSITWFYTRSRSVDHWIQGVPHQVQSNTRNSWKSKVKAYSYTIKRKNLQTNS